VRVSVRDSLSVTSGKLVDAESEYDKCSLASDFILPSNNKNRPALVCTEIASLLSDTLQTSGVFRVRTGYFDALYIKHLLP